MRVLQNRARLEDFDARIFHVADIDAVQAVYFAVLVGDKFLPGKTRLAHAPAEARRILEFFGKLACIDEKLFRYATANDAGAADAIFLRHGHLCAMPRRDAAGAYAARTRAYHKEIEVVFRRRHFSAPVSSALPRPLHIDTLDRKKLV